MAAVFGDEPSFRAATASPATTQPPFATTTTMDGKPQLTAKDVLQQCEVIFQEGDSSTRCFPWFPDFSLSIYDDIRQCWVKSNSSLKLRLTSTATFPIILELMPCKSHGMAVAGLAALITETFGTVTHCSVFKYFFPCGADRIRIDSPSPTEKQADASFAPGTSDDPSVIIEVGRSETINALRGDISRWFSVKYIKLVILVEISKPTPQHPELPTLRVGTYHHRMDETKRHSEEFTLEVTDADWTTGIPGPLRIPLCTLLGSTEVPDGWPQQLELPVDLLELLRLRIISVWTSEQKE